MPEDKKRGGDKIIIKHDIPDLGDHKNKHDGFQKHERGEKLSDRSGYIPKPRITSQNPPPPPEEKK